MDERIYSGSQFWRDRSPSWWGDKAASYRYGCRNRKLRDHISNQNHGASAPWGSRVGPARKHSKPAPSMYFLQQSSTSQRFQNFPKWFYQLGIHFPKGHFSFKLLQSPFPQGLDLATMVLQVNGSESMRYEGNLCFEMHFPPSTHYIHPLLFQPTLTDHLVWACRYWNLDG